MCIYETDNNEQVERKECKDCTQIKEDYENLVVYHKDLEAYALALDRDYREV